MRRISSKQTRSNKLSRHPALRRDPRMPYVKKRRAGLPLRELFVRNSARRVPAAQTQRARGNNQVGRDRSKLLQFKKHFKILKFEIFSSQVPNEEVIYNAVLSWLKYNDEERSKHLSQLIGHIRFPLLSPKFLTDVCDKEPMIKRSFECRDLLDEAKKFYLRPDCRSEMTGARFKPRNGKKVSLF